MTEAEFAARLRSLRTTTAAEAAEVERKRDLRNGVRPAGSIVQTAAYEAARH
jgi:hypothetical protein